MKGVRISFPRYIWAKISHLSRDEIAVILTKANLLIKKMEETELSKVFLKDNPELEIALEKWIKINHS